MTRPHFRKCWECGHCGLHQDDFGPAVACPKCRSRDTRRLPDDVKLLQHMTEPELRAYFDGMFRQIRNWQTADTIGCMLVVFQADGITQYGATIDPATAPQALRELADRLERRQTIER